MTRYAATDLAVVIPTRDRWDTLKLTLGALRDQTTQGFTTIVISDGEDQVVPPLPIEVQLIQKQHAGPGAARNAGVRATERPLVLLLGDDMVPKQDLVERHLEGHRAHPEPEVAILGHVDWHPDVRRGRLQKWLAWSGTQFDFSGIDGNDAGAGRFYSSNISVKRAFFLESCGFDEDFPFVYEDIDLGIRLARRGLKLLYDPEARTWHLHRYTWASLLARFAIVGSGEYIFGTKHPEVRPYFLDRITHRRRVLPLSPWPWLVDLLPEGGGRLRRQTERRADSHYLKRLTGAFLTGWTAGAELVELRRYLASQFDYARLSGRTPALPTLSDDAVLYQETKQVMDGRYTGVVDSITAVLQTGGSILCYGAGTGSIGLHLASAGYDVTFVGVKGPPFDYLGWRIEQRQLSARLLSTDHLDGDRAFLGDQHPGFSMVLVLHWDELAGGRQVLSSLDHCAAKVGVFLPWSTRRAAREAVSGMLATAGRRLVALRLRPGSGSFLVYSTSLDVAPSRVSSSWIWHVRSRLPARRVWPPVPRS